MKDVIILVAILLLIPVVVYLAFVKKAPKEDEETETMTEDSNNPDVTSESQSFISEIGSSESQSFNPDAWKDDIRTIRQWVQFFGWFAIASFIISIIATLIILN